MIIRTTFAGATSVTPYSINLAVGVAGTYQVGGWVNYVRDSDGRGFISAALRDTQGIV